MKLLRLGAPIKGKGVVCFRLRLALGLDLLRPVGHDGPMLGMVSLAAGPDEHPCLKPLANQVIGVQLIVHSQTPTQARLKNVPSLRSHLHAVLGATVREIGKDEALVFSLNDAQLKLHLRLELVYGGCFDYFEHIIARIEQIVAFRYKLSQLWLSFLFRFLYSSDISPSLLAHGLLLP